MDFSFQRLPVYWNPLYVRYILWPYVAPQMRNTVKTERFGILSYLQANNLASHHFMDVDRRPRIAGSDKGLDYSYGNTQKICIFLHWFPEAQAPRWQTMHNNLQ